MIKIYIGIVKTFEEKNLKQKPYFYHERFHI